MFTVYLQKIINITDSKNENVATAKTRYKCTTYIQNLINNVCRYTV